VTCRALHVSSDVRARLDASLLVVWLGHGHSSSAVHQQVIAALRASGPDDDRLEALRRLAHDGALALESGDLTAYGRCLSENTALQQALHPALVGRQAAAVIATASEAGALGWKVNGAGGDGGTVTVLCLDVAHRAHLAGRIGHTAANTRVLPVHLACRARGSDDTDRMERA
jgi:D-glycero-alpha-D-manno-heptose-7-phosphate kinase